MSVQGQSVRMSALETLVSVVVGYFLTVLMQYVFYPLFGITIPVREALIISILVVAVAFLKNYCVRRLFNAVSVKASKGVSLR